MISVRSCLNPVKNKTGIYLLLLLIAAPAISGVASYYLSNYIFRIQNEQYQYTQSDIDQSRLDGYNQGYTDGYGEAYHPHSTIRCELAPNATYIFDNSEENTTTYLRDYNLTGGVVCTYGNESMILGVLADDVPLLNQSLDVYAKNFTLISLRVIATEDLAIYFDYSGLFSIDLSEYANYTIILMSLYNYTYNGHTTLTMTFELNGVIYSFGEPY